MCTYCLRTFVSPGFVAPTAARLGTSAPLRPRRRGSLAIWATTGQETGRQTPLAPREEALSGETPRPACLAAAGTAKWMFFTGHLPSGVLATCPKTWQKLT